MLQHNTTPSRICQPRCTVRATGRQIVEALTGEIVVPLEEDDDVYVKGTADFRYGRVVISAELQMSGHEITPS